MRIFALLVLALVAGCSTGRSFAALDMSRLAVPCGVELAEPFALSAVKMDGAVTCASPNTDGFASYAAASGPLALLRVQAPLRAAHLELPAAGVRVSLVTNVGGLVSACDEWTGMLDVTSGPRWTFDLDLVCGDGTMLRGLLFGDDAAH